MERDWGMVHDKIIGALLHGYKPFIMSYVWVNQQHNEANWSPKPLNMALFLRILSNNQGIAREACGKINFGQWVCANSPMVVCAI